MNGTAPMIAAEASASIDIAPILPFIFLRSRTVFDEVADRLGKVAAGLGLDFDDDGEEVGLGRRHALRHLHAGLGDGDAERLRLDDLAEFGPHRLRRLVGDDSQRVAERQAGAHAAHDDVERGGQRVDEFLDAPLASAERARNSARPTPTVIATSAASSGLWDLK